jgi:hypothetical protein
MTAMRYNHLKVYRHTSGTEPCVGTADRTVGKPQYHDPFLVFNVTAGALIFMAVCDHDL